MKKDFENQFSEPEEKVEPLSEDELALLKASIQGSKIDRSKLPPHDNSDRAKLFRLIKKNKLLAVCSLFLAVVLVAGIIFGCVVGISALVRSNRKYTFVIDGETQYEISKKEAVINDVLYIDMRKIAHATEMMLSGTESKIQFTSKNGSYIIFENENGYAIINGRRTEIRASTVDGLKKAGIAAYVSKEKCLVPLSFLEKIISPDTMRIQYDPESRTIYIDPKYTLYDKGETKVMSSTRFIPAAWSEPPVYKYDYILNMDPYLENITAEYLLLVNRNVHLAEDYVPEELTKVEAKTDNENQQLVYDAERALYAMMLEMEAAGIEDIFVTSSYRSYKRQIELYWETYVDRFVGQGYSWEEAQKKASEFSARPGESEHQSGLCLDFSTKALNDKLTVDFEKSDAFKWLSENAYKFGFILRFPKEPEKLAITGYSYEPWHYRFVGRQAATEMYYSGECLEEYLAK
ncbi:MAG: D-alanyl-D-alanine carboxypeptidase family protein [Ruminococcaceae bacterium]|nr:D-alanyl-D-alanine carboxypeptidase family protein [Oscillospiraceae bacterium]